MTQMPQVEATVPPALAPSPTPTPIIHTVALGEMISSIALRYGLDMADVLAANPDVDPYTLTVGTELVIPNLDDQPIGGIPREPLPLVVSEPQCSESIEGDWWCLVLVSNPLDQPAANISVRFSLMDESGEVLQKMNIPTSLNRLAPGDIAPAAVLLDPQELETPLVHAEIASALPLEGSGYAFFPIEVLDERIETFGRRAQVTANIAVNAPGEEDLTVWAVAMAYDGSGRLVGLRRAEYPVQVAASSPLVVQINVFSARAGIAEVRLVAEAFQLNP